MKAKFSLAQQKTDKANMMDAKKFYYFKVRKIKKQITFLLCVLCL